MSDPRAYGHSANMALKRATTEGEAPSGNYHAMPFYTSGFGGEQTNEADQLAGQGRDPQKPNRGDINVSGAVVVPVDPRYIGFWLTGLLGDPVTTEDTGVYTHVFKSGKATLPEYGLQTGHPNLATPSYDLAHGVKVNTLSMSMARSGALRATFDLIGLAENAFSSSQAGTLQTLALANFGHVRGVLKKGGTSLANISGFNFSFSNNLVPIATVNNAGELEGIDPGLTSLNGSLDAYFASRDLLDDAIDGTPIDLELSYALSEDLSLTFAFHELYLDRTRRAIDGPGGISYAAPFNAAKNTVATAAMTVTLVNDVAGNIYVPA